MAAGDKAKAALGLAPSAPSLAYRWPGSVPTGTKAKSFILPCRKASTSRASQGLQPPGSSPRGFSSVSYCG